MTRRGGNVMWFHNFYFKQRRGWGNHGGECSLKLCWLHHIGLEEPDAMCCCSKVCCVDQDWSPNECLDQVVGLGHCCCALLARIGVLQDVDQRRSLLKLEKVDDAYQVVEIVKAWIHCIALSSSTAHTLALPTATQHAHWTIVCY